MVAHMRTALLRPDDKKEITANEALANNETRAFCPGCKQPVRLHQSKKIANHFEHLSRTGRCAREHPL
jgi:competence CoiA-like predicted nuclease